MPKLDDFYESLNTVDDLEALKGQPESATFECKLWTDGTQTNHGRIAKAVCGFTNATGGVLAIGLYAHGGKQDLPDLVHELKPVADPQAVASRVSEIIAEYIEPRIVGVTAKVIRDRASDAGYVIVFVPASEDHLRRSRVTKEFYIRVTAATYPMEYYQIEERFGRRPQPNLHVELIPHALGSASDFSGKIGRAIDVWISNVGRGLARFPGIRIARVDSLLPSIFGIDGSGAKGLTVSTPDQSSILIRGGADDVIYPGERYLAARLTQRSTHSETAKPFTVDLGFHMFVAVDNCAPLTLACDIYAAGMLPKSQELLVPENSVSTGLRRNHERHGANQGRRGSQWQ